MYIEHFVLLAGAYNLGFFIELAEYFIFFIFFVLQVQRRETNFLCMYRNVKQQRITPRYILSDWGIPQDKTQFIHNLKLKAQ